MEEGDRSVDQSIEAEVQGDGPALHNVSASIIDCIAVPCTKIDFEVLVTSPLGQ